MYLNVKMSSLIVMQLMLAWSHTAPGVMIWNCIDGSLHSFNKGGCGGGGERVKYGNTFNTWTPYTEINNKKK